MFDIICYRLKGHLNYQCQIVPSGQSIQDVVEAWQNITDTHRVTGFTTEAKAREYVVEKYEVEPK
ncbi:hypothetical protein [Desulforamulus ruminis]|uniref:Uncharacterized protein n=1 Tax=Desulforamulus ruminis (strain ATCC 23193 / DSM 2154 / NCIMB 8452 / DL) TaxID=696281 RepID=F6DRZ1_DESRL|nr:hypothetical protein [Desulforamulus ruminis]AEG61015.1 hypothetical protein Desru_2801 [Desulforamulus ruminis DSM 2154]